MLNFLLGIFALLLLAGAIFGKPANPRNWWARPLVGAIGLGILAVLCGLL
jgi:hypothetical protein